MPDKKVLIHTPPAYLSFWGKAYPSEQAEFLCHPVAWHCLDVAAVCYLLLHKDEALCKKFSTLLKLPHDDVITLLTTLSALHDIGKFAPDFQQKNLDHWPIDVLGEHTDYPPGPRHDAAGYKLWVDNLEVAVAGELWPEHHTGSMRTVAEAAFGHHGKPVSGEDFTVKEIFGSAEKIAREFWEDVLKLFALKPLSITDRKFRKNVTQGSWFAAGFFVLCDWIGSNQNYFPYQSADISIEEYWHQHALKNAEVALSTTGIVPSVCNKSLNFSEIVNADFTPSPLQEWALNVEMPKGPALFIIEDVTGAGKTEAAQILVQRRIAQGASNGAYWALPTQATTDAMFERQKGLYENLYKDGEKPVIVLSHGKAKLKESFTDIILPDDPESLIQNNTDTTASGACSAWIADDRRRAFLADIGVGTIDQAVLGILPSKYQSLRLHGLSRRVLVADEVHAHDAYLGKHLQTLLQFQAVLGGDAVLLSATLPTELRQKFIDAYCAGRGRKDRFRTESRGYPLTTVVSDDACVEQNVKASDRSRKTVSVKRLNNQDTALEILQETHNAGGCGVYIRNTVDEAIASWQQLKEQGVEPLLFHARMTQYDRLEREAHILSLFGKKGSAESRAGQILISSPILQESLDLDFDVMISDLAPMDLIIQRAGRWRRHGDLRDRERPENISNSLMIISPEPVTDAKEDWYAAAYPKAQYIYKNHAQLWLTAKCLFEKNRYKVPEDLRRMIEDVFSEDAFYNAPETLHASAYDDEGRQKGDISTAHFSSLEAKKGYGGQNTKWESEERILTRLGAETTTVRLAKVRADGTLIPWAPVLNGDYNKAWALSEIRVRQNQIRPDAKPEESYSSAIAKLKGKWSRWQQDIVVLPMVQHEEGWRASLIFEGNAIEIRYAVDTGLIFI